MFDIQTAEVSSICKHHSEALKENYTRTSRQHEQFDVEPRLFYTMLTGYWLDQIMILMILYLYLGCQSLGGLGHLFPVLQQRQLLPLPLQKNSGSLPLGKRIVCTNFWFLFKTQTWIFPF